MMICRKGGAGLSPPSSYLGISREETVRPYHPWVLDVSQDLQLCIPASSRGALILALCSGPGHCCVHSLPQPGCSWSLLSQCDAAFAALDSWLHSNCVSRYFRNVSAWGLCSTLQFLVIGLSCSLTAFHYHQRFCGPLLAQGYVPPRLYDSADLYMEGLFVCNLSGSS